MCGQHVRASAGNNTGQNIDKGHTPNPRTEIKIPDTAGNRTRVAGLEGRYSTDHATATDYPVFLKPKYLFDTNTGYRICKCVSINVGAYS